MRAKWPLWVLLVLSLAFIVWSVLSLATHVKKTNIQLLLDSHITGAELAVVIYSACLFLALVVLNESAYLLRSGDARSTFVGTRLAWLLGLVASNANAHALPTVSVRSAIFPAAPAMSPVAAVSVLAHIERRRRDQLRFRQTPDVLTEEEIELLRKVRESAALSRHKAPTEESIPTEFTSQQLINAVERIATPTERVSVLRDEIPWVVEVKVFGYPMVVSVHGDVAEFRKKRALELLTWLALNRDRGRRSAARTALWDIDVTDSSFSTVVSDMRRALRDLDVKNDIDQWVPTTYSDELPLSPLVVTDADRLQIAHNRFVLSEGHDYSELLTVLKGIRDVPFAGTNYSWADLDGTTTRLVISAVDICIDVARRARVQQNKELLSLAVSAGLRVFPGCEELLEIQDCHFAESFTRRSSNDTHHFA